MVIVSWVDGGVSPKQASGSVFDRFSIWWIRSQIGSESDSFRIRKVRNQKGSESKRFGIRKVQNPKGSESDRFRIRWVRNQLGLESVFLPWSDAAVKRSDEALNASLL